MKKLNKKSLFKKKKQVDNKKPVTTGGITKDTIEDYRKEIIKEGRKFKYPLQYSKHKVVINALLISSVSLFLLSFFFIWQLYAVQNTGTIFYRITQVVPLPVAFVDGQHVRYSDYLMKFRSEKHYLETKEDTDFSTKDGQRQAENIKRQAMNEAVANAYAAKIAKQKGISVSRNDAREYIAAQQKPGQDDISDQTLKSVLRDYYGWSMREYEQAIQQKLLTQKVRYATDTKAQGLSKKVEQKIRDSGRSLEEVAGEFEKQSVQFGSSSGLVPKNNRDGGLAEVAATQSAGEISQPKDVIMGDGYYIIKTIEVTDTSVSYEYIKIPLTEFDNQLKELQKADKIRYLIHIDDEEQEGEEDEQI